MIIGGGDLASVIPDHPDRVYFAAGVSNSGETSELEYFREIHLVLKQDPNRHLVYFSSLCVFYVDTRYARHKRYMEHLVRNMFRHYTIIRLGNITWGTNPHTLINYLRDHPHAELQDEYRYICSESEFLHWISMIPKWNCEINIPGERLKVEEVADKFCRH